jgi:predicted transglutaminase-like cysteine proteinase
MGSQPVRLLVLVLVLAAVPGCLNAATPYGCDLATAAPEDTVTNAQSSHVLAWKQMLNSERFASDREKLERVNHFFNTFRFCPDLVQWGQEDYWATPAELLRSGVGDCEDFALAKYISLRCLGVPVHRLRLTYTVALRLEQPHMVLVYVADHSNEPLVLDNLVPDICSVSERPDLVPVYSFNDDDLWLNRESGDGERIGDAGCLQAWNALRARIQGRIATSQ